MTHALSITKGIKKSIAETMQELSSDLALLVSNTIECTIPIGNVSQNWISCMRQMYSNLMHSPRMEGNTNE